MGNVRKGNIVLFYPQNGQTYTKVPDNTFYDILNTARPECNGKFKYLSVVGKRLHELEYENGHLKYFGYASDSTMNQSNGRLNTCVDWYWVYTWYDELGNILSQYREYYTTTCQGEDCQDPYNAMLCPMDNSSGGGTGSPSDWEFAAERPMQWVVHEPSNLWWYVMSYETLSGVKVQGEPDGGHFTGNVHNTSSVFNNQQAGFATWQELQNAPSYTALFATTYISGKVTFTSFPDVNVNNKRNDWQFSSVFP